MRKLYLLLCIVFSLPVTGCSQNIRPATGFPAHVGDIAFNASKDDPAFIICDSQQVFQYYNTRSWYLDHKKEIVQYFKEHYSPTDTLHQTGYITIRFIINCKGQTGRFRVYELDSLYQSFHFSGNISGQLLQLSREFTGWRPAEYNNRLWDSYQYITFRIINGRIISISP